MAIRVLIADDQPLVRAGLRVILDHLPDIEVIGEGSNGHQAVALARQLQPDVCLFDIRMPEMDGIEATRILAGPQTESPFAVVVITTFDLDEYVYNALLAGARGFVLKDAGPDLLDQAIRAAANGDALICPSVTARLLTTFARSQVKTGFIQPKSPLTEREEAVLTCVASGLTNGEISEELHVSISTVKTHITNLMNKLVVRNRVELAIWAHETGRV